MLVVFSSWISVSLEDNWQHSRNPIGINCQDITLSATLRQKSHRDEQVCPLLWNKWLVFISLFFPLFSFYALSVWTSEALYPCHSSQHPYHRQHPRPIPHHGPTPRDLSSFLNQKQEFWFCQQSRWIKWVLLLWCVGVCVCVLCCAVCCAVLCCAVCVSVCMWTQVKTPSYKTYSSMPLSVLAKDPLTYTFRKTDWQTTER